MDGQVKNSANGDKKDAGGILTLLGFKRKESVSEEEIKSLISDNQELLDKEKKMITGIMELDERSVREIMIPRVDMMLVEDTETVRQAMERMRGTGYSRLPVFHEESDDIIGVIHYKDLMSPLLEGKTNELVNDYTHKVMFVPETKDILPLLAEFQQNHQQMAIVIDEYGGTAGLVTLEDIIEEIVGEIVDETDRESAQVRKLAQGVWEVEGRLEVDDALEMGFPLQESDDYETLAGWLLSRFDTVPEYGDSIEIDGYSFTVSSMRRRRIMNVRITRLDALGNDNQDNKSLGA